MILQIQIFSIQFFNLSAIILPDFFLFYEVFIYFFFLLFLGLHTQTILKFFQILIFRENVLTDIIFSNFETIFFFIVLYEVVSIDYDHEEM